MVYQECFLANKKKILQNRFFFSDAKLVFIKLKQTFIKVFIVYYSDLKYYIQMKTNKLSNAISKIFSELTLNNLV